MAIEWTFKKDRKRAPANRFHDMVAELKDKGYLTQDGKLTGKGHAYCIALCQDNPRDSPRL